MAILDHEKTLKDAIAHELACFLLGRHRPESVVITVHYQYSTATLRIDEDDLKKMYGEDCEDD